MENNGLSKEASTRIEEFIKTLGKSELLFLNRLIVERLKLLSQIETSQEMSNFGPGDMVAFSDAYGNTITGRIIKMNKKTVTIYSTDNARWNVHPSFLRHV